MFSDPKALKVIKYLLKNGVATQKQIAEENGVAIGYVNEVIRKMRDSFLVSKPHARGVYLADPFRLMTQLSLEAPIEKRRYKKFLLEGSKKEIEERISKEINATHAFTLLSALPYYSTIASGEQVSLYVSKGSEEFVEDFFSSIGAKQNQIGNIDVFIAHEGIMFDAVKRGKTRVVSKEQLIIDLHCFPPLLYVGSQLLQQHWEEVRRKQLVK